MLKYLRLSLFIVFAFIFTTKAKAQSNCNFAIQIPDSICAAANFSAFVETAPSNTVRWDFCAGDAALQPTLLLGANLAGTTSLSSLKVIEDGGNYYGFVLSSGTNQLIRLDYGANPNNTNPVLNFLSPTGGVITNPGAIEFYKEGAEWFGLLTNRGSQQLFRFAFGNSIENNPTITILNVGGIINSQAVRIVKQGSGVYAFVASQSNDQLIVLNFGGSITNTPTFRTLAPGTGLRDLEVVNYCGNVYVFAINSVNRLLKISFLNGLNNTPAIADISFNIAAQGFAELNDVSYYFDLGRFYLFFQGRNATGQILARGMLQSPISSNFTTQALITSGVSAPIFGLQPLTTTGSQFTLQGFYGSVSGSLQRQAIFNFPNSCNATLNTSVGAFPAGLNYSGGGKKYINVEITDINNNFSFSSDSIFIVDGVFAKPTYNKECITQLYSFNANACASGGTDIVRYRWAFGDGDTSALASPTHTYPTGSAVYNASLLVQNSAGQTIVKTFTVLHNSAIPVVGFAIQPNNCTNTPVNFVNTSVQTIDTIVGYSWDFGGLGSSNLKNPSFTFASGGTYSVALTITTKSGCSQSISNNVVINATPIAAFGATSLCEGLVAQFIDSTVTFGQTLNYVWNFGDNTPNSTESNPSHVYSEQGTFVVQLTTTSLAGCVNTTSKPVIISAAPTANFRIASGGFVDVPTQFLDSSSLNTQNIVAYNWNFADPSAGGSDISSLASPLYTYHLPGTYNVRYIITTNSGCTDTIFKTVIISQACPEINISATANSVDINSPFSIVNSGVVNPIYNIDYCEGDLQFTPIGSSGAITTTLNNKVTIVKENGRYYGFLTNGSDASNQNNQFIRLDFDSSLNNTPRQVLMGNPGNFLNGPAQLAFYKESGNWYAITVNTANSNNNLIRMNFGATINSSTISAQIIPVPVGTFNRASQVLLAKDKDSIYVFVVNSLNTLTNNNFIKLNFGTSILNAPRINVLSNPPTMQSASGLSGIDIVKACNEWFIYLVSSSGQVFRMEYGVTLANTPNVVSITSDISTAGINPTQLLSLISVSAIYDRGNLHLYLSTASAGPVVHIVNQNNPRGRLISAEAQNWSLFTLPQGLTFAKESSTWFAFSAERTVRALNRFRFPNNCSASVPEIIGSNSTTTEVRYSRPGTYYYTVEAIDVNGNQAFNSDSIIVTGTLPSDNICPTATFDLPFEACSETNIPIQGNIPANSSVEIDACVGELTTIPVINTGFANFAGGGNMQSGLEIEKQGTDYYGFFISETRLWRLSFGPSLLGQPSAANTNVTLLNCVALNMFNYKNQWYGLGVNSSTSNTLYFLQFGNSLNNTPLVNTISTGNALANARGISVIEDESGIAALVCNLASNSITMLRFGNNVNSVPEITNYPIAGASSSFDISMVRECNRWYGLITDNSGNGLIQIAFPSGISNSPTFNRLANATVNINLPQGIKVVADGENYHCFIQNSVGDIIRIALGTSLQNNTFGNVINYGNYLVTGSALSFSLLKQDNSQWVLLTYNTNRNAQRLTWNQNCPTATLPVTSLFTTPIRYNTPGTFKSGVTIINNTTGNRLVLADSVIIRSPITGNIGLIGGRCTNNTIQFLDQSVSNNPQPPIRIWNFGDTIASAVQSNLANPVHRYKRIGNFTVTLRLIESSGCTTTVTRRITISRKPIPRFIAATNNCTNDSILISDASVANGDIIRKWEYFYNGTKISDNRTFRYLFPTQGFYPITLRITGESGCDTSYTNSVEVIRAGSAVSFNYETTTTCFGDETQFSSNISSPDSPVSSIVWTLDPGAVSNTANPTYRYPTPGERRVTLTVTNADGCQVTRSKMVNIQRRPEGTITLGALPCVGFPADFNYTLTAIQGTVSSHEWLFGDGGSSREPNPVYVYSRVGRFPISLRIITNGGCVAVFTDTITVNPSPVANFGYTVACAGRYSNFTDSSSANGLPGGITTYGWDFGNGQTSTLQSPDSVLYSGPGIYNIRLTVVANGCANTMTKQILIPDSPTPIISVFEGCDGVPYRFTDSSRVNGAFDPTTISSWLINGQQLFGRTIEVLLLQGLPQDVLLNSYSPAGCAGVVSTTVTPGPRPTANFRILDSTFSVAPFSIRFQNRSTNVTAVKWFFGDGDSSNNLNPTHIYTQEGVYTITLIAYKPGGCSDTLNRVLNLVINAQPDIQVTQGFAVKTGNEVNITAELLNKGNIEISSLLLNVSLNSDATLQEAVNTSIKPGQTLSYTFKSKVLSNTSRAIDIACIEAVLTGSKADIKPADNRICISSEMRFAVLELTPNPVGNTMKVRYVLPNGGNVKITIIDVLGREVSLLAEGNQSAGVQEINFNSKALQSGYYNLRVRYENQTKFQRFFKN